MPISYKHSTHNFLSVHTLHIYIIIRGYLTVWWCEWQLVQQVVIKKQPVFVAWHQLVFHNTNNSDYWLHINEGIFQAICLKKIGFFFKKKNCLKFIQYVAIFFPERSILYVKIMPNIYI